jgi:hypothetical protein
VSPATDGLAEFIAGFIAAEGTFVRSGTPPTFTFAVALGATDAATCEKIHGYFGVGAVRTYPRRKAHYDDEVLYNVRAMRDLIEVILPFMDEHLPPSYKRDQYEVWRAALVDYWQHGARQRGRRPCIIEGCDRPQRAKDLCRHHYFEEYRR